MALNIEEVLQLATEHGFEREDRGATISNRQVLAYKKRLPFSVRGEHSYDICYISLVVDEQENRVYLCYKPSIDLLLPCKNKDYASWLDLAADFAGDVTGYMLFIAHDFYVNYGRRPMACEIEEIEDMENLDWFVSAIISYQTVIEAMVYEYFKKENKTDDR